MSKRGGQVLVFGKWTSLPRLDNPNVIMHGYAVKGQPRILGYHIIRFRTEWEEL